MEYQIRGGHRAYEAGTYDCVVVGAGHAGCEAALATARMGCETLLLTLNMDAVALMACNPAVGGSSKGHLVREVDALGGEMGLNIDATMLQCRMLNQSKGPAIHALRAQADKKAYQARMKQVLENQERLTLRQAEVIGIGMEGGRVAWVETHLGARFCCRTLILATGVYLKSRILVGDVSWESGPQGLQGAHYLSDALRALGIRLQRFKTGTPARVDARSVDFDRCERQDGDSPITPFSFRTKGIVKAQLPCYMTYTNARTHKLILDNLHRAPMYQEGVVKGVGARYCPSIEDKVVRFADKERHQLFLEPEGANTRETYVQGLSTSMPEELQLPILQTIAGLEHVRIIRPAYAIEYDCIDPLQLDARLAVKGIGGLYMAGQLNGTSGYEEAAAQGILAGINAACELQDKEPLILGRGDGYIGVLVDDLSTRGTREPYRMMTSRAEYRLLLRQDNADLRLTEASYRRGLADEERFRAMERRWRTVREELESLKEERLAPDEELNAFLEAQGSSSLTQHVSAYELCRRPELTRAALSRFLHRELPTEIAAQVDIQIHYEGYLARQEREVALFRRREDQLLPEGVDYIALSGLRLEARAKLQEVRPRSLGQASRIPGVSPADVSVLMVYLEKWRREGKEHG